MPRDAFEEQAREYLESRGFRCRRFSKMEMRSGRTPDFRVFIDDQLQFYCEVKGIERDRWMDDLFAAAPPGAVIVGGSRPDPVPNRLSDDIHQAVGQFDAVNPNQEFPNVLILVNSPASHGDYGDLLSVLTGQFFAESGRRYAIYGKYADGRIRDEKSRVHLYVWLEAGQHPKHFFPDLTGPHTQRLCTCFGIDVSRIRPLG